MKSIRISDGAARCSGSADSGGSARFLRQRKRKGKRCNENQGQRKGKRCNENQRQRKRKGKRCSYVIIAAEEGSDKLSFEPNHQSVALFIKNSSKNPS